MDNRLLKDSFPSILHRNSPREPKRPEQHHICSSLLALPLGYHRSLPSAILLWAHSTILCPLFRTLDDNRKEKEVEVTGVGRCSLQLPKEPRWRSTRSHWWPYRSLFHWWKSWFSFFDIKWDWRHYFHLGSLLGGCLWQHYENWSLCRSSRRGIKWIIVPGIELNEAQKADFLLYGTLGILARSKWEASIHLGTEFPAGERCHSACTTDTPIQTQYAVIFASLDILYELLIFLSRMGAGFQLPRGLDMRKASTSMQLESHYYLVGTGSCIPYCTIISSRRNVTS